MRKSLLTYGALCCLSFAPLVAMAEEATRFQLEAQEAWDNHLKKTVLSTLKDPDSAKFECVSVTVSDRDNTVMHLEINAKNSYGGYTGRKCYVYMTELLAKHEVDKWCAAT